MTQQNSETGFIEVGERVIIVPAHKWSWDVLGRGILEINTDQDVSWRKRFWTRVFFGSKWTRLDGG